MMWNNHKTPWSCNWAHSFISADVLLWVGIHFGCLITADNCENGYEIRSLVDPHQCRDDGEAKMVFKVLSPTILQLYGTPLWQVQFFFLNRKNMNQNHQNCAKWMAWQCPSLAYHFFKKHLCVKLLNEYRWNIMDNWWHFKLPNKRLDRYEWIRKRWKNSNHSKHCENNTGCLSNCWVIPTQKTIKVGTWR